MTATNAKLSKVKQHLCINFNTHVVNAVGFDTCERSKRTNMIHFDDMSCVFVSYIGPEWLY